MNAPHNPLSSLSPVDTCCFDNRYARLSPAFYRKLAPTPLPHPYRVSISHKAAALIGLDATQAEHPDVIEMIAGNRLPLGADPLAMNYAGHQFGTLVPQLGDGRALLLGEILNPQQQRWTLQLKGAGPTPFSRHADGRAVLRSSIREYLASEAMHALGIATTRAVGIVGSDQVVYRETAETAAVLLRIAPSHVRFGSFEVFYYRNQTPYLKELVDEVIETHFHHLQPETDGYEQFLIEVIERTARLMAQWQAVGFCHGVMNTDNMSILGLTLDYGPFGFMEAFNPQHICNHSDEGGRYSYENQPAIGLWNCSRLAQALTPLIDAQKCNDALALYANLYREKYYALMRAKLGLGISQEGDETLIDSLLDQMGTHGVDFTHWFRALCGFSSTSLRLNQSALSYLSTPLPSALTQWLEQYTQRLATEPQPEAERQAHMRQVNPKYVLRNHLAQVAIDKATTTNDFSEVDHLLKILEHPFDEQPDEEAYAASAPDWAKNLSVSCSS